MRNDLTQEQVRELFDYDSVNGILIRNFKSGLRKSTGNKPVCEGYGQVSINRKLYLTHRVIWLWYYGVWPVEFIDHMDGDRMNNRIENLRSVNRAENNQNASMNKTNSTGFPGVCFNKQKNKYQANIVIKNKKLHLGYFNTPEEAFLTYQLAKIEYHLTSPIARQYLRELTLAG